MDEIGRFSKSKPLFYFPDPAWDDDAFKKQDAFYFYVCLLSSEPSVRKLCPPADIYITLGINQTGQQNKLQLKVLSENRSSKKKPLVYGLADNQHLPTTTSLALDVPIELTAALELVGESVRNDEENYVDHILSKLVFKQLTATLPTLASFNNKIAL